MDVIDEQLEALEWVQEAGAEPEAVTEVFAQCGTSLDAAAGLVEVAACATGVVAGVAGVATGVAIPAIVLFGLLKWLTKDDKKFEKTEKMMKKVVLDNEVKKLSADLKTALEVLEGIQVTENPEGKKEKVDKGDGILQSVINSMLTQLNDAKGQKDGFNESQFELFSQLQFAMCARLLSLNLQRELKSKHAISRFDRVRDQYATALKELCEPYCKYRTAHISVDWQEGSLSKYEAVLIQDTLKDTFVWARPKNRKPAVMVAGVLQKGIWTAKSAFRRTSLPKSVALSRTILMSVSN